MEIEADAVAKQVLTRVCDAALKYGGTQMFNLVGLIIMEADLTSCKWDKPPETNETDIPQ